MSNELTKKAVDLLLKGATLVSDPCPYCKGVRVIKEGSALCVNCGREDKNEIYSDKIGKPQEKTLLEDLEQKLKDLSGQLQYEQDPEKQQKILKSINDIIMIREKLKKI